MKKNHPDQAETSKFRLSDIENLYNNRIFKNAEVKLDQKFLGNSGIFAVIRKKIIRIKQIPQNSD